MSDDNGRHSRATSPRQGDEPFQPASDRDVRIGTSATAGSIIPPVTDEDLQLEDLVAFIPRDPSRAPY
jgi:hypothetical protein